MIVGVDRRSLAQKTLRIFARAENGIGKTQFHFFLVETFSNYFDIVGIAAGVLNFAPAEVDLALDSEQKRLLALSFSRFRNIFCDKVLPIVEQHPVRFAGCFVFQDFAAERIRRVLVDLRDPQRSTVRNRSVTVRAREKNRVFGRDLV